MIHFSNKLNNIILVSAIFLLVTNKLSAQENKDSVKTVHAPKTFISNHSGVFGGKTITYTATAKEIKQLLTKNHKELNHQLY